MFAVYWYLFGAGIAQSVYRLGYGLNGRGAVVRVSVGTRQFSLHHNIQTSPGGKAAGS
jgi:hypothetical protein